jgi:hypothetical protein
VVHDCLAPLNFAVGRIQDVVATPFEDVVHKSVELGQRDLLAKLHGTLELGVEEAGGLVNDLGHFFLLYLITIGLRMGLRREEDTRVKSHDVEVQASCFKARIFCGGKRQEGLLGR